jgi:hypothetical protein
LKLVLEIVAVVLTFAAMGGCALASWFAGDSMLSDLNRNLPASEKTPLVFGSFDSRTWLFNMLREHRRQFPQSKLRFRLFLFLALQAAALALLGLELGLFKTFHLFT